MQALNSMDLPSEPDRPMSDQDVLVQEEFQRQIVVDSGTSGSAQDVRMRMNFCDGLWKPVTSSINITDINQPCNEVSGKVANPVFCLACDTMYSSRLELEQHVCPCVSFICPCGISFGKYHEMWSHSKSHNHKPTYIVNHRSAMQNRLTFMKERESKLKFLEAAAKNVAVVPNRATPAPTPPSVSRFHTGQTVNFWRRFKPVVRLETRRKFYHRKKYTCAVCRKGLCKLDALIEHVAAAHSAACLYGCRRCGLVLISSIPPKPLHRCGSFYSYPHERFTVGQVLRDPLTAEKLFMPYSCPYCTLKFCHAVHLSNHIQINHINMDQIQEAPTIKAHLSRTKGVEPTLARMPHTAPHSTPHSMPHTAPHTTPHTALHSTPQKEKLRCALCGKRNDSIEMLGEHWCVRKLTLIASETTTTTIPEKAQFKLDLQTGGSQVTFRFQDISNMKTHGHTKLLTIKTEPVEVNLKMTQDFSRRMCVKAEPELHTDSDGGEKASAEMNGLFYQKCSVPTTNNLKYLLSSI